MSQIGRLWRTVRHLTCRQLIYQLWYRLRRPARLLVGKTAVAGHFLAGLDGAKPVSWQSGTFTFLHQSVRFGSQIDWNYACLGKLWTYHLAYFDYLNQPGMALADGVALIRQFMQKTATLKVPLEAYPTSIRIGNWVQFLSRHRFQDDEINRHLAAQIELLSQHIEYHLSGNHLLENGLALLTGALYFRQLRWFRQASALLHRELAEQILADGGHYERSVVYHQLLLDRLLDGYLMLQTDETWASSSLLDLLKHTIQAMQGWLTNMTFRNGDVPMMNDAAPGLAPTTAQLIRKANAIVHNESAHHRPLSESGYRMMRRERYELVATVGTVGPRHQPGHAHADTFSFMLYVDNQPIIVDTGTSTYEAGARRQWERGTAAHNTVTIFTGNSSEVWANFRVGRRARVMALTDSPTLLRVQHDGYRQLNCLYERTWYFGENEVTITDRLLEANTGCEGKQAGVARFYMHPSVAITSLDTIIWAGPIKIVLQSATKPTVSVLTRPMANGFNQTQMGHCLEVAFTTALTTRLVLRE